MDALRPVFGGHTRTCVRGAHLHAVTRARIRANPPTCACARKEESDRFDLGAFFLFLPGRIPPLPSDPLPPPPFFRTARQDHQSASRGLLRGYATRLPPRRSLRVPGEVSPIRASRFSLSPPLVSLLENFRDSSALSVYRGLARRSADTSALMKPRRFDE